MRRVPVARPSRRGARIREPGEVIDDQNVNLRETTELALVCAVQATGAEAMEQLLGRLAAHREVPRDHDGRNAQPP
jgi:hypothetical protein